MLSLARSRYTVLSQLVFTAFNGVGVFLATIYNAETPDLYPNNAHHSIGWVATCFALAQFVVSSLSLVAHRAVSSRTSPITSERNLFLPLSRNIEQSQQQAYFSDYRLSDDEGQSSESARSHRSSSASTVIDDEEGLPMPSPHKDFKDEGYDDLEEQHLESAHVRGTWTKRAVSIVSSRVWSYISITYKTADRIILPLGFIALTTGIATAGRFFVGFSLTAVRSITTLTLEL